MSEAEMEAIEQALGEAEVWLREHGAPQELIGKVAEEYSKIVARVPS